MIKKYFSAAIAIIFSLSLGASIIATPASAVIGQGGAPAGVNAARGSGVPSNLANGDTSIIRKGINLLLYGIGVISVVMLIYGGFRYIISGGKKEAVTNAKNTILYAIIGLLVAIFAYAIIQFVLGIALTGGDTTDI